MTIDDVLHYARPEKIGLAEYDQAGMGRIIGGIIFLNSRDSKKEIITALVHEILHMDKPFLTYTLSGKRDELIEAEIEASAQHVVATRPGIVDYLDRILEEATKNQPKRSKK